MPEVKKLSRNGTYTGRINALTPTGVKFMAQVKAVRQANDNSRQRQAISALTDLVEGLILNDEPLWAVRPLREDDFEDESPAEPSSG